jgi:hypothetical protein
MSSSAIAARLLRGSVIAARVLEERPHAERTSMHDCPGRSNQPTNIINNADQSSLGANRTFRSQSSTDYLFTDAVPGGPEPRMLPMTFRIDMARDTSKHLNLQFCSSIDHQILEL